MTCCAARSGRPAFEALIRAASLGWSSTVSSSGSRLGMSVRVQFSPDWPLAGLGMFWEQKTVQSPGSRSVTTSA